MTALRLSYLPPEQDETACGLRVYWPTTAGTIRIECFEITGLYLCVDLATRRVVARKRTLAAAQRAAQKYWRALLRGNRPAKKNKPRKQRALFA